MIPIDRWVLNKGTFLIRLVDICGECGYGKWMGLLSQLDAFVLVLFLLFFLEYGRTEDILVVLGVEDFLCWFRLVGWRDALFTHLLL